MSLPGNGIFVVRGEMAMLVTALRRSTRWGSHSFPNEEYDVLIRTFHDLRTILNQVDDLRLLDPATYLSPFLEVIRSKETTGPVTSLALSAIHKFLSYGLIDPTHPSVPATVEDIADAVTHARFVGTDHSSDGVVLMKILQVLQTLMLSPEGAMLTDESVCEIMLTCFRICFETRLTELLRRNAEQCLRDMTQLIFMRVPQFAPEGAAAAFASPALSLKKREKTKKKPAQTPNASSLERNASMNEKESLAADAEELEAGKNDALRLTQDKNLLNEAEITIEPVDTAVASPLKKHARHSSMDLASDNTSITLLLEKCVEPQGEDNQPKADDDASRTPTELPPEVADPSLAPENPETPTETSEPNTDPISEPPLEVLEADGAKQSKEVDEKMEEYVNDRGIRFTPQDEVVNLQPYGLVCVRELFRFLISLCNPLDGQNTSAMVHLGLSLVGTALEVAADQVAQCPSLLLLLRDPLCRNLTSLLSTERISIFALDLQISFLLFEALRYHLKFQMEAFFKKIIEIISTDTSKATYELKEIQHLALEYITQMFRIPGLCTEFYLNYDCDIYCMNLFEELTKLLSKNVVSSTAFNIHSLSLEALMTIIEAIEAASNQAKVESAKPEEPPAAADQEEHRYGRGGHVTLELGGMDDASVSSDHVTHDISLYVGAGRVGRHRACSEVPTEAELDNIRNMKKWMTQGTELFNQKPDRGVEFLQQHGILRSPLDVHELARWLRENPDLDKKMIGEYICKRSSRGEDEGPSVLGAFADSFDFSGLRIDQALRLYLETFRLPGEAPLIFLVMERFAERWHSTNGEPFANTDAAFRLAYAVIMLNMDQHNHNAKKLNIPMTVEDFVKNLRGCNGSGDFDQPMLEAVFHAIKNEEMVMPAERVGPVRDAYLWRVLQRRGNTHAGRYMAAPARRAPLAQLHAVATAPAVTALSAAFDRAPPPTPEEVESSSTESPAVAALDGLSRCAALLARLPHDADQLNVDSLLLTLCKATGLLNAGQTAGTYLAIGVTLGQSTKAQAALRRACAVAARHADCVRAAWRHLLDIVLTLFIGRLLPKSLVEAEDYLAPSGSVSLIREAARGSEAGLLSSLYSYIALGESGARTPTPHERALIETATACVAKCQLPSLLVTESKFLQVESLRALVRAELDAAEPPDPDIMQTVAAEDQPIFFLELLGQTLIQNRDRSLEVWEEAGPHYARMVTWAATRDAVVLRRALTALLRTCARLMRSEHAAPRALARLNVLLQLPYKLFYQQADVISCGLYELVKTSAQNVHSADEWRAVFALLAAAGAGAWPRPNTNTASSRSEGSEDEVERRPTSASSDSELSQSPQTQGWILVQSDSTSAAAGADLDTEDVWLRPHRATALARCCEALALVVRDVAHVTPYNCRAAVRTVRLFVRATLHGGKKPGSKSSRDGSKRARSGRRSRGQEDSSDEEDEAQDQYLTVSMQLLDLMHTLHSRTAQIFRWWREEADHEPGVDHDLWSVAWMPLLQGIAQFCTDRRKQVSNSACAYLQRALLAPALACMGGARWEACFTKVLFPLLEQAPRRRHHPDTIMCKVFLHHLSALSSRPTFAALWLRVVGIQRSLVTSHHDDPVTEAALESLKNMILVMNSVKIFSNANGDGYNDLWYLTWEKVGEFLPTLKDELFPQANDGPRPSSGLPSHMQPTLPSTLPTLVPVPPTLPSSTPTLVSQPTILPQDHSSQSISPIESQQNTGHSSPPGYPGQAVQYPSHGSPPGYSGQAMQYPGVTVPPVSGMVPIRNTLYVGSGLTSSVLLQPLNEMISTPIGTSSTNQMPILYPHNTTPQLQLPKPAEPSKTEPKPQAEEPFLQPTHKSTVLDISDGFVLPEPHVQQTEIYTDYINNPYNEVKEVSSIYDPQADRLITNPEQTVAETLRNPLLDLDRQKSLSANTSPMHSKNKTQYGSSDNLKKEESGMFNFSSYFGLSDSLAPGSEVFDNLMSTQEG